MQVRQNQVICSHDSEGRVSAASGIHAAGLLPSTSAWAGTAGGEGACAPGPGVHAWPAVIACGNPLPATSQHAALQSPLLALFSRAMGSSPGSPPR